MTKAKPKSEFYKGTTIPNALLDELMHQLPTMPTQEDLFGPEGVVKQLSGALIERCLQAELSTHLGYEKNERAEEARLNHRNGYAHKTLKGDAGEVEIAIPRDREGSYDPLLVKRGQRSLTGFNEKILWLYAHGLSTRDIQAQILDWYGVEVSPQLISNVTEAVMDEVRQWQNRPLEALYPILYMDCLQLKVRENQRVINKAVYLALGVTMEGHKELLGMWIAENEGARILAGGLYRTAQPGDEGLLHCLRRRPDWLSRGHRKRFPTDSGAVVHSASGAQLAQIRQLQTPCGGGQRFKGHLLGGNRD